MPNDSLPPSPDAIPNKPAPADSSADRAAPSTFSLTPQERAYLATLGPLRVAFDANLPPYAYLDDNGRASGIAGSYLSWLSSTLGLRFQRVPTDGLASRADALRAGSMDMAAVASRGNPLWDGLPVSQPYATFPIAIFGRADALPIDGVAELAGKRIAVTRFSGLASTLHAQIPGAAWIVEDTVQQALQTVRERRADVYLGGLASADIALQHDFTGQLRVIGSTGTQLSLGFALKPALADRLAPLIDRAIAALPEDRRLDIQHRYLAASYQFGPSFRTLLLQFGPAFAALWVVIAVLSWMLTLYRRELRLRRRAEHELSSQLDVQRELIDAFPIPMVVRNASGQYQLANVAAEKLIGRPRAALLGKTLTEIGFWSGDSIERMDRACDQVLRSGRPYSHAISHVGANGEVRYFLSRIQPFRRTGSGDAGVICISDDVTEIRQAEFLAQQAQRRLASITRHLPLMVFQGCVGPGNVLTLLWVSGNTEAIFGIAPERLMLSPTAPDASMHPDDRLALLSATEQAQHTREPLICELRVRRDDDWRWTRLHAIATPEPDGRIVWNGYWMDTAAEREQFDLLSRARDHAETALRARDRFLALMSHEIRTPMSGVLGLVELLAHTTLNQEQAAMVGMIESSASALMQILNDLLDYSKIAADKIELEALPVDVRELCDMALGLLAASAHEKGLRMRLSVGERVAAVVIGDGLRLRQILFNLLSNAIKFTTRGEVSLALDVEADDAADPVAQTLVWCVSDTGIGIARHLQDKLFEPFFQADASTTRRFGGTGLGLSICQQLVQLMGGTIAVSSDPGRGTRFTVRVRMPVKALRYAQPALAGLHATVSLADAETARSLAGMLRAAGAHADVCAPDSHDHPRNPDRAHAATTAARTDLLFLDDGRSPGADAQASAVIHTTLKAKPSGFRLTDEDIRLSVNPLSWHGVRQVALAALERRDAALRSQRTDANADADADANTNADATANANADANADADPNDKADADPAVATQPPATPAHAQRSARDEALASGRLILIAEDHATNRLLLQRQLGQLGYVSDAVGDGEAAWQALARTRYALLITDCHMPGLSGYELAERIRAGEKANAGPNASADPGTHLPIIAITANTGVDEVKRCQDAGMDVTLFKPVQLQALRDCLPRYLPVPRAE